VQVIGPEGGDEELLAIAEALEAELGGFQPPPQKMSQLTARTKTGGKPAKARASKPVRAARPPPARPPQSSRPKPEKTGKPKRR
jgi:hypothetical protein